MDDGGTVVVVVLIVEADVVGMSVAVTGTLDGMTKMFVVVVSELEYEELLLLCVGMTTTVVELEEDERPLGPFPKLSPR